MIETNNLEINVDELMQKVREEAALRQKVSLSISENANFGNLSVLRAVNDSHAEALLNDAELYSHVPTEFPAKFNRFPFSLSKGLQRFLLKLYGFIFKKQRVVNASIIQVLRESVALNQQLIEQVTILQSQLKDMSDRIATTDERLAATDERLAATDERLAATDERLSTTQTITDERLRVLDERHIRNDSYLKNDLAQQKRLVALFLEQARQRLPEPFNEEQLKTFVNEEQFLLDGLYTAFEDRFRGSREDILNRLKVYLPLLKEAKVGTPELPILDVGCGRGEWLELLRESGYTARGLDLNRVMVDYCQAREIEVVEGDVISYLQSLPDLSLGAVTGFHIIEHLSFPVLKQFLNEAIRVLKPGGLVIVETPNPKNLVVGACNFYSDPTHRNPLFPDTIQFLVESQGLSNVQILYLHPVEGSPFDREDAGSQLLHTWFFCSRDYAVVGYKL
jgi:O-antigen chain-terminating methyltransferase